MPLDTSSLRAWFRRLAEQRSEGDVLPSVQLVSPIGPELLNPIAAAGVFGARGGATANAGNTQAVQLQSRAPGGTRIDRFYFQRFAATQDAEVMIWRIERNFPALVAGGGAVSQLTPWSCGPELVVSVPFVGALPNALGAGVTTAPTRQLAHVPAFSLGAFRSELVEVAGPLFIPPMGALTVTWTVNLVSDAGSEFQLWCSFTDFLLR